MQQKNIPNWIAFLGFVAAILSIGATILIFVYGKLDERISKIYNKQNKIEIDMSTIQEKINQISKRESKNELKDSKEEAKLTALTERVNRLNTRFEIMIMEKRENSNL